MNDTTMTTSTTAPAAAPLPLPLPRVRVPLAVRPGTIDDLPFVDALQKQHARMVG
jgi:hypothetical protein